MFKKTLTYRLFLMLLAFSLVLIIPISLIIHQNSKRMIDEIEKVSPLQAEQKTIHAKYIEGVRENFISLSFYVFTVSFIMSLFFARKLLMPVKELFRGAMALKEGALDIKLDVAAQDELGEVTKTFNEMAVSLKKKTDELMWKDRYISAMLDPLWVVDQDNIVIDINPAFTKLFGYQKEEIIGSSIYDFLDEENEAIMRKQLYSREEGISSTYAISIISKKGALIPVLISGSPILSEEGEVIAKIGTMKDFRQEIALRDALKKAKEYREAIMDSMVDPMYVVDKDFVILMANRAAQASSDENIIGKQCHAVFHKSPSRCYPEDGDCPVSVVFDTGQSHKTIHEHIEKTGEKVFHEIIAYPLKDEEGTARQAVLIMRDVTEKKRFEEEIAQKNKELTTLNRISMILNQSLKAEDIFNSVMDRLIEMTDMDGGGIYFLDDLGRELTCRHHRGLSEDFSLKIQRIRTGEDIPGRVAATGQIFSTGDISRDPRVEKSILKHTGIKAYSCFPIRGKEKTIGVFYIFSFNPHTFSPEEERIFSSVGEMTGIAFENIRLYEKMKELYHYQRLRRVEEQKNFLSLSSLLATRLDIKEVLDSALSLVRQSFKADFLWFLEADTEGNLILKSAPGGGLEEGILVYPAGTSSIEGHASDSRKTLVVSELSDESRFYISEYIQFRNLRTACSIPICVGDKSLGAFTLYYSTPREPKEEDVFFLQTVASMLYVAIERARLYDEVDRMKTDFVRAVSHEFRTPLSAIVGMTEMLIDGEVSGENMQKYLGTILSEGRRLSDMVSDLLDVAKIESGARAFKEEEIDFESIIEEIKERFKEAIKDKRAGFSANIEGSLAGYTADKDRLLQLLRNLVQNSLTFSDPGLSISISIKKTDESIMMQVKDTGWGIPEEDILHMGEKFFRGLHGMKAKGTGLGLSLCKEIAKLHGGQLHIRSTFGKGTTVTVELPFRRNL